MPAQVPAAVASKQPNFRTILGFIKSTQNTFEMARHLVQTQRTTIDHFSFELIGQPHQKKFYDEIRNAGRIVSPLFAGKVFYGARWL